jgi:hypothetical protein
MKISRALFYTLAICYLLAILIVLFAGYVFSTAYHTTRHVPFF